MKTILLLATLLVTANIYAQDYINAPELERKDKMMFVKGADKPYTGIYQVNHNNGALLMKGEFVNGLKVGRWAAYDSLGVMRSDEFFINDKWEGERKIYFANGELNIFENYKNGVRNGINNCYYENKQLQYSLNFINGLIQGEWICYHPNGQVWQKGNFVDNLNEGKFYSYDEKGNKTAILLYEKGKLISEKKFEVKE